MEFESGLMIWEHFIVGIYLIIIGVLSLAFNVLVVYTCFQNWKTLIHCDLYILSLACSDLFLTLSTFALPIVSAFCQRWMFESEGCAFQGFLGFFFGVASVAALTTMGFVRYINICHPHIDISKPSFTLTTIIFPYCFAFAWATCPLSGLGVYELEAYGTSCSLQGNGRYFMALVCVFCVYAPLVIIFFSYGSILFEYKSSSQKIKRTTTKSRKRARKDSFLIRITFLMCFCSLLTWVPYAAAAMWSTYGQTSSLYMRFTLVASLLSKSSTVTNPLIYFLMSKKLRPLLIRSITLTKSRSSTPQSTSPNTCKKIETRIIQKDHSNTFGNNMCTKVDVVKTKSSSAYCFDKPNNNNIKIQTLLMQNTNSTSEVVK